MAVLLRVRGVEKNASEWGMQAEFCCHLAPPPTLDTRCKRAVILQMCRVQLSPLSNGQRCSSSKTPLGGGHHCLAFRGVDRDGLACFRPLMSLPASPMLVQQGCLTHPVPSTGLEQAGGLQPLPPSPVSSCHLPKGLLGPAQ